MTNIAILFSPGPFGGAEQVVLKSTKELDAIIWLIKETRNPAPCDEFIKRCEDEGLSYNIFECRSQFDRQTINEIKDKIKKTGILLIHSHGMKANFFNSLLPVKRVATQHGKTSHSFKTRILESIEHISLKKMDQVICVSEKMYLNVNYKHKTLIDNFLSLNFNKTNHKDSGSINLVAIGRLSPEKGIADVVEAINTLEDVYLTIVGDGSEMIPLKSMSKNRSNISFVGFHKDISKFIQQADALIMPSHTEGLPMTLIEATAASLPVIASNVGGIPSLVHKNGLLFEAKNIQDIREKILLFKSKRKLINEQAKIISENVKEKYSKDKWVKLTKKLYSNLL